ncbi:YfjI family protein [Sandarakinorhabdus sp.]|uniref:YfjI family protein n=1 Tax=Sandarakinorhabdus sp. TaxID=1916663 RepID=UPI00286E3D0A|nr:YfjI family protein [Sandarakinorhabdus sp.]
MMHDTDTGELERPDKLPLFRALPPGAAFPVDALPDPLAGAIRAISGKVECPEAIAAGSVLAVASLGVQGHADVQFPLDAVGVKPTSLFVLTVAESGSRKTSADRLAMAPVAAHEREMAMGYVALSHEHSCARAAWEAAKRKCLSDKKVDQGGMAARLKALGQEPAPPMMPILTVADPTLQGLERAFKTAPAALGLFSDEGGKMLGGWSMQSDNKASTLGGLNALWDGGPIKRMRAGEESASLHGRRLALHLMFQPVLAPRLLADREAIDTGLTARMLVSAPHVPFGHRFGREVTPADTAALGRFNDAIASLLSRPYETVGGDPRHLAPRKLSFAPDAAIAWKGYSRRCEARQGEGEVWERMRGWGSKAAEHAGRIAGVLAMLRSAETHQITAADLDAGIVLAEFYAGEMLRLQEAAALNPDLVAAEKVLAFLTRQSAIVFPMSLIYQSGPACVRDKATAERVLMLLAEHGLVRQMDGGAIIDGTPRKKVWRRL